MYIQWSHTGESTENIIANLRYAIRDYQIFNFLFFKIEMSRIKIIERIRMQVIEIYIAPSN